MGPGASSRAYAAGGDAAERFVASVETDASIAADVRTLLRTTWQGADQQDGAEFLAQALSVISPKFRQMLEAYDADNHVRCIESARELQKDANPFLAANAAVMEIKALVALGRTVEAGEQIESWTAPERAKILEEHTYAEAEIAFLRGFCFVSDLNYKQGMEALAAFLEDHPNAPQRLTIAAQQMLLELATREPGEIGEVVDLMNNSHARLKQGDSGEVVQGRQQKILDLLDKLIKEAEDHEKKCNKCNKCNKGGGGGSGSSGGSQNRQPKSPMEQSQLPSGGSMEMDLREARRANPAESWGALPPAQRERILQALKESFPSRYRRLVEQYYEELAKKP